MFNFIFKTNEEKLKKTINTHSKLINHHIFIRIDKIDFEFYIIPEDKYDDVLLRDIEKFSNDITYLKSGAIIKTRLGYIIISYETSSLETLCKILEEKCLISKSQFNRLKYDVDKYLSTSYIAINQIKEEFPNTIITTSGIIILKPIIPIRFVWKSHIGKIPKEDSNIINSLEFTINSENKILSVKLDNIHPNCDSNSNYCLGDLKFLDLNLASVKSIIKSVEVYNLTNSYFIPKNIQSYLQERAALI